MTTQIGHRHPRAAWIAALGIGLVAFTANAQFGKPQYKIAVFDAPGAGTGTWLDPGTQPNAINQEGAIVGNYADANRVNHGFLRHPDGSFKEIDAPGAGKAANQGTFLNGVNQVGAIVGYYAVILLTTTILVFIGARLYPRLAS